MRRSAEEVGDLFVTENLMVLKLLPSNKSASQSIVWFSNGAVTNGRKAAKDIAELVTRLRGKSLVVRGLTLMTDKGIGFDVAGSGLDKAVKKAGFELIN